MFTDAERRSWRGRVAIASIGPITAATAAEYGLATDIMPGEYTIPALARAIAEWFARAPHRPGGRGRRNE
jgi:uroporphyrinogen-III synthase